ncbi:rluC [Symbiodinium necroappetens]|uniref:RluC protein n=1 Tax=Symbiodinium necroappetens TaxID=1628268 RepID=A0A812Z4F4_9DINO|nr:rluC [Symbiodinium necroappetens]
MRHRLAAFLEDEILARSSTLAPKAIANLSGLLYGCGVRCEKNRAVMQLRQSAMQKLQAFSASELVDLASGLANSRVMDESCLQTLRKRMDAAASRGDSDAGCSRQLAAPAAPACERDWPLPCPGILADLETAVVLSKPPGWSCATSISGKSLLAEGRKRPPTISHFLQRLGWERPVSQDPSVDHGLVHRIDLETSGALLAAKTFHSYWRLRLDFSAQDVRKRYLALVHGFLPRQWQRLDMPLQLQRIPHSDSLRSVRSKSVVNHDFGRSAETGIRAIAHLHGRGGGPMSLLLAEPRTGRTHQIRSHVSHIGHPIVGDSLYATSDEVVDDSCQRVFLHCFALNFLEPVGTHDDREPCAVPRRSVTAPLPADLIQVLRSMAPADRRSTEALEELEEPSTSWSQWLEKERRE